MTNLYDELQWRGMVSNATEGLSDVLAANPIYDSLLVGNLKNAVASWPPPPTGPLNLYFDHNSMKDLWIAVTWGKGI